MYTIHGLVRAKNLELGIDEDTGGQIVYVLELAKALSQLPDVGKIEVITRKIEDLRYPGYNKGLEKINEKTTLVRLSCGPKKYVKKVDLWPYLDEFAKNAEIYTKNLNRRPDIIHSNYADGGYVGRHLAKKFHVPLVHVSHSLAKPEIKRLRLSGKNHLILQAKEEQKIINDANAIVASSEQEKNFQYGMYKLSNMEKIYVIPPGIDFKKFKPDNKKNKEKFPVVLAMARIDAKKNLIGSVEAFSKNKNLQKKAKLSIASSTFGAKNLSGRERKLIAEIKNKIKNFRLENVVSLVNPNGYGGSENLYRLAAQSGGIFINPALFEGFGLTTLEAGACGVPVVVTKNGGPAEVVEKCKNGIVVDPRNTSELANAIEKIIGNRKLWKKFSENGLKNIPRYYSWPSAAKKHIKLFKKLCGIRESNS